jgi:hypothetical protein
MARPTPWPLTWQAKQPWHLTPRRAAGGRRKVGLRHLLTASVCPWGAVSFHCGGHWLSTLPPAALLLLPQLISVQRWTDADALSLVLMLLLVMVVAAVVCRLTPPHPTQPNPTHPNPSQPNPAPPAAGGIAALRGVRPAWLRDHADPDHPLMAPHSASGHWPYVPPRPDAPALVSRLVASLPLPPSQPRWAAGPQLSASPPSPACLASC